MRQFDQSSRDHANDIHEYAETTERSTVGETWGDEAEMDDELRLNVKVKRRSTSGGDKPYEERQTLHNDNTQEDYTRTAPTDVPEAKTSHPIS